MKRLKDFWKIIFVDAEFKGGRGENPRPVCFVFHDMHSGETIRIWCYGHSSLPLPYEFGSDVLFVSFFASAELGCFIALNWAFPIYILDLYVEFRRLTCNLPVPAGNGLLGALAYFGLDGMDTAVKESMCDRILKGGVFSTDEQRAILDYCESDVVALRKLFSALLPAIDLPRALVRGDYMRAVAMMECNGVPIDLTTFQLLMDNWNEIQDALIGDTDVGRNIYEGRTFKTARFMEYCARLHIVWPKLPTGNPALDDDTFREMARRYPREVGPIRELRHALSQMRLSDLQVGADGRNRCLLSPFASRTGRNQPSNTKFIFGPAVWLRSLIKAEPGRFVAYVDYSQQEIGIAAALSNDRAMMAAYASGDLYLTFAKQAGAVPLSATKASHPNEREQFKICALAVQYGMWARSLADKLGVSLSRGQELLALHRKTYPPYWDWSDATEASAFLTGKLEAAFGWCMNVRPDTEPRSLRNFPSQANGAEMIRLACCLATRRGIQVCCPVHDALLVEGPIDQVDEIVKATQQAMREASEFVLPGFPLRTDAKIFPSPQRYSDPRGKGMWDAVCNILAKFGKPIT